MFRPQHGRWNSVSKCSSFFTIVRGKGFCFLINTPHISSHVEQHIFPCITFCFDFSKLSKSHSTNILIAHIFFINFNICFDHSTSLPDTWLEHYTLLNQCKDISVYIWGIYGNKLLPCLVKSKCMIVMPLQRYEENLNHLLLLLGIVERLDKLEYWERNMGEGNEGDKDVKRINSRRLGVKELL